MTHIQMIIAFVVLALISVGFLCMVGSCCIQIYLDVNKVVPTENQSNNIPETQSMNLV